MASASTWYVDFPCRRQVCRSERIRSTQRLPLSLLVPWLRFRQSTAWRSIRSPKLLVGSTPSSSRKVNKNGISASRWRTSLPASLFESAYRAINRWSRAYKACHCPLVGGSLAIVHNRRSSSLVQLPHRANSGSFRSARALARRIRWAKQLCRACFQFRYSR